MYKQTYSCIYKFSFINKGTVSNEFVTTLHKFTTFHASLPLKRSLPMKFIGEIFGVHATRDAVSVKSKTNRESESGIIHIRRSRYASIGQVSKWFSITHIETGIGIRSTSTETGPRTAPAARPAFIARRVARCAGVVRDNGALSGVVHFFSGVRRKRALGRRSRPVNS
ncbi:hypothetical protein EVAR_96782_1 [Eumeta japonica]|uniref:Uncharacterized protein n=1 Tax=Eumeta variegata TaxID=151549 RepID=A0A4C1WUU0_EUMVA|nr:hypothetical protein EVAR_96782_1 [Eumeta japonica]